MLLAFVVGGLLAASAPAPVSSSAPKSVYQLEPLFDDAAIVAGSLTVVGAYAFSSHLIHETCPCDPNEVNAFDRIAIGLESETANLAGRHFPSDVIVGMASGVVVGYLIPKLHERTGAMVAITPSQQGGQVSLGWRW